MLLEFKKLSIVYSISSATKTIKINLKRYKTSWSLKLNSLVIFY